MTGSEELPRDEGNTSFLGRYLSHEIDFELRFLSSYGRRDLCTTVDSIEKISIQTF